MKTILRFTLAALIVVALGALAGWYLFLKGETQSTAAENTARGFGSSIPSFGGALGSAYQNAVSSVFGGNPGRSETGEALPRLWQVVKTPVAGAGFVATENGMQLYFAERSTGYVFSADPRTREVVRLTNTLLPKTYEALFSKSGGVIARSIDAGGGVTTFAGAISASSTGDSLHSLIGISLPKNIGRISASPFSEEFFYLARDSGKTVGIRAKWNGTGEKQFFSSGIADWQIRWLFDGRVILFESPADNVSGYAYELKGSGLVPLVRGVPGLTILPRASSTALIYGASNGALSLFARTSGTSSAVRISLNTIAEKCVWSPSSALIAYCAVPQAAPGGFLGRWYRGEIHTKDTWWQVDVSAGTASILYSPEENLAFDVQDPVIDESGSYIAFVNGADRSLWMLRVAQ